MKLTRYGSVSYGVEPNPKGRLLYLDDVYDALLYILDDDNYVRERAEELLRSLEDEWNDI